MPCFARSVTTAILEGSKEDSGRRSQHRARQRGSSEEAWRPGWGAGRLGGQGCTAGEPRDWSETAAGILGRRETAVCCQDPALCVRPGTGASWGAPSRDNNRTPV